MEFCSLCVALPQQRGTSLVHSRDSFSREFFGEQQECGEVLPTLVRDGVLQALRGFLMGSLCSADDEQGVWRHGAQEERSGGWSVQHHPGQHLLTLQVLTHFQLSQQSLWETVSG